MTDVRPAPPADGSAPSSGAGPTPVDVDEPPLLDELMPWSVAPLRPGRGWVAAPDAAVLRARWAALTGAADEETRAGLFRPSRARTLTTSVAALPGQRTGTGRLAREAGPCPEPVRVAHGPFEERWLLPDHRLLDAARPELWRVADGERQVFLVEQGYVPKAAGPALLAAAALPDDHTPAGRPGRVRPLYRRPGGREPNVSPGLAAFLGERYGRQVAPEEAAAWAVAAALPSPSGCRVPLPADPEVWAAGVALGRRMTEVQLRGARGGERPRLPGGRRPYVRAALPPRPDSLAYEAEGETLVVGGSGRIAPVPEAAWEYRVGGVRMLELWFAERTAPAEPGTLEAIGPAGWPQEWTSELLELITVLALQAALEAERTALDPAVPGLDPALPGASIGRSALEAAGVLPVPAAARRPASVLEGREEGPEGQLTLL